MELYHGITFMKRILGIPSQPQEPPWDPWNPARTPLGPTGTLLGTQGTPLGTPLGDLRDAPGHGPQKHSYLNKSPAPKLSIAVLASACWDPSHEELPRAVSFIKSRLNFENTPWSWNFLEEGTAKSAPDLRGVLIYNDWKHENMHGRTVYPAWA